MEGTGKGKQPPKKRRGAGEVREAAAADGVEPPARKNFRLRQSLIDRAMKALGTRSETETIEQALELVVFRQALVDGVAAMRGAGLADVFGAE